MVSSNESRTAHTKSVDGRYGFAMLNGDIHLVQLISCSAAPRIYQVHVFRHNFVSLFSYSHTQSLGSNLLELLENDDDGSTSRCLLLEEDTNTLFVAPNVMSRYVWLKDKFVPRMGMPLSMNARPFRRPQSSGHNRRSAPRIPT